MPLPRRLSAAIALRADTRLPTRVRAYTTLPAHTTASAPLDTRQPVPNGPRYLDSFVRIYWRPMWFEL